MKKITIFSFLVLLFMLSSYTVLETADYSVKTIVIDAGHGGKDPGCKGTKHEEADVALAIAKKVGEKVKANIPGVKVVYTRDTDKFIELHERAQIANKNSADLFISIHCNAAGTPAAYGTETYTMGLHKTTSQLGVMERENSVIELEENHEENYKNFEHTDEYYIMREIMQSANIKSSNSIAAKVEKEFKLNKRHSRGVNQAGFLVLWKTTMPSILIETGFLTNKNEETYLGGEKGQNEMAESIFKAIKNYKTEQDKLNEE